ncbi:MAG: helix-turn-helix domain-containing protein [Prevotellaceae bacterium]|jgi:transcriptional regulator with XRE-family HTH domain|nr:helix-turn-helix domain-containing protein [Prevotellaceae bacterium]
MASFGLFIKTEREKQGWTQTEFGAKIEINSSAVSRIENGSKKFSKNKLSNLAKLFQIDLQEIIDLFFADKFATEAHKYKCSENVFIVAEDTVQYLTNKNSKQRKLNL